LNSIVTSRLAASLNLIVFTGLMISVNSPSELVMVVLA